MKYPDGPEPHSEIREGVHALYRQFDSAYWQKVDEERGDPDAFVEALTKAGWLSALMPEEYGGSGLTLTVASVIMEEINRSGGIQAPATAEPKILASAVRFRPWPPPIWRGDTSARHDRLAWTYAFWLMR